MRNERLEPLVKHLTEKYRLPETNVQIDIIHSETDTTIIHLNNWKNVMPQYDVLELTQ